MRDEAIKCDRCGEPVTAEQAIVLHSFRHSIGTSSPFYRLDLCEACGASFKQWRDTGGKP